MQSDAKANDLLDITPRNKHGISTELLTTIVYVSLITKVPGSLLQIIQLKVGWIDSWHHLIGWNRFQVC